MKTSKLAKTKKMTIDLKKTLDHTYDKSFVNVIPYDSIEYILKLKSIYKNEKVALLIATSFIDSNINEYTDISNTLTETDDLFPLTNDEILYTNLVKLSSDNNTAEISVISVLPIESPKLSAVGEFKRTKDQLLTTNKIEAVFKIAVNKGITTIVLQDFGVEHYHNPINSIVEIYKNAIIKYKKHFKHIVLCTNDDLYDNYATLKDLSD
jgi:hypothetical protein